MAANCDVCGKGPGFGHSISHSHIRTKRRWNPNIQRVRAVVAGTPKRLNVCTSCLKAGKVTRPACASRDRDESVCRIRQALSSSLHVGPVTAGPRDAEIS